MYILYMYILYMYILYMYNIYIERDIDIHTNIYMHICRYICNVIFNFLGVRITTFKYTALNASHSSGLRIPFSFI